MFEDIKLGFKMMRYAYNCRTNIILGIFFLAMGFLVEIIKAGDQAVAGVYFMMMSMLTYQMIMSLNISNMIRSCPMKKRIEVTIPAYTSGVVALTIYTVIIIEKAVLITCIPERKEELLYTLLQIITYEISLIIFTSICYKTFLVGTVVFVALFMSTAMVLEKLWNMGLGNYVLDMGLGVLVLAGYVVIIAGIAFEILIGRLTYRRSLSEYAFKGVYRASK